jgi:hypothetical protein
MSCLKFAAKITKTGNATKYIQPTRGFLQPKGEVGVIIHRKKMCANRKSWELGVRSWEFFVDLAKNNTKKIEFWNFCLIFAR